MPVSDGPSSSASPACWLSRNAIWLAAARVLIRENRLPDYLLAEAPGDILRVTPRDTN